MSTVKTRGFLQRLAQGCSSREHEVGCWEDRRAAAERGRDCGEGNRLGQHLSPQQVWYGHNARTCSALSSPWGTRGLNQQLMGDLCYHGEKGLSCTGELSCGSHSCGDTVPPGGCILMGLMWWCREEAVVPQALWGSLLAADLEEHHCGFQQKADCPWQDREREISWSNLLVRREASAFWCGAGREISCGPSWASSVTESFRLEKTS